MKNTQNLQAWEALLLAVKTGNISQTALLMELDISKVSRLISGLEEELGFALLNKSRRPFTATKKCEILIDMAEPLVKGFKHMETYAKGAAERTLIRISSPIEIAQEFYSSKLIAYSHTHPQMNFEIVPETEPDALMKDEADVIVVNKQPQDDSNLVVRPFMRVLCSPEYLRRYGVPKTPEDLKHHTGLLLKTATHSPTMFLEHPQEEPQLMQWKTVFVTHDQLTIKRLLLNHQGITPDLYFGHVIEELKNGDLVPILQGWERKPWMMALVTRQDKELENPELRNFVDWWARSEADSALDRVLNGRKVVDLAFARMKGRMNELESR